MPKGYVALVLHAHLPFVRHPEYGHFLEEDWLYEAITETYIPLLRMMEGLSRDGVPWKLTMSLTPPLLAMLSDDVLKHRYAQRLDMLIELAEKEIERTKDHGHLNYLAHHYHRQFVETRDFWRRWEGDLIAAFRSHMEAGNLEIMTCAATHAYLPHYRWYPEAVRAQISVAVDQHIRLLGQAPKGIWLPECAYYPGLDKILAEFGLRYFVMDAHGVLFAHPRPRYDNYAPIFCEESGVAAFGRDLETSIQVWSKDHGYPGDPMYREFYRDIGWDLPLEYIGPYVQPDGKRKNVGIKYHRITGKTEHKELYDPYWARERAAVHAGNFMFNRERQIEYLYSKYGREPIVVAPYDAELFGHWWYEGPWWLDYLFRKSAYDQDVYEMIHLADYLRRHPTQQVAQPAESSWGNAGYHEVWLSDVNAWIYKHLHKATERMVEVARENPEAYGLKRRALNQMVRELMLAQSSDWAFIMKTGTMVEYAQRRTENHIRRFNRLYEMVKTGNIDEQWLVKVEALDNIFPFVDYRVYR